MSAVANAATITSVRYVMVRNVLYAMPAAMPFQIRTSRVLIADQEDGVEWKRSTPTRIGFNAR